MIGKRIAIYSPGKLTAMIKAALEENIPSRVAVRGQITNLSVSGSGHAYFGLKDENSIVPCVMWRGKFAAIKFVPENGMEAIADGAIDVYPPHGRYQLVVEQLEPAGVGALHIAFEQMVKRLQAQGLFRDEHKKPLPAYPERIAILTSQAGAAVGDIEKSIHDRWPPARLFLYPVPVQGEGASEAIAAALGDINMRNDTLGLDLVIVGRGGGSLEDLWAFNEEPLARAIFQSRIPVISAVGHEIDTTIADLVADARASTPTRAGSVAVPDMREVLDQILSFEKSLRNTASWTVQSCKEKLKTVCASSVFKTPLLIVNNRGQQLDEIAPRITACLRGLLAVASTRLQALYKKVSSLEPHRLLAARTVELHKIAGGLAAAMTAALAACRLSLSVGENRLSAMDPRAVLNRGYSITSNKKTGLLVRKAVDIEIGDELVTQLADRNFIESTVSKK